MRHDGDTSSARFARVMGRSFCSDLPVFDGRRLAVMVFPTRYSEVVDAIPVTCTAWVVPFCRRQSDATSEVLAAVG